MAQANTLLRIGDVIRLTYGMEVYATFPECFIYGNRRDSPVATLATTNITIGEVRSNGKSVPGKFPGVFKGTYFDTGMYVGEYLVTHTKVSGGGTGHGRHDVYPDGHHVTVKRLQANGEFDPKGIELTFYQSGSFTAMIQPSKISPIRHMEQSFS